MSSRAETGQRPSGVQATGVPATAGLGKGVDNPRRIRPEIESLRAFSVLAVLLYHLNANWLPGGFVGVDVFFVISGFLITSHLAGELGRTGTISLSRFYGRRITRLIPAATLVLVSTALAVALVVPRFIWRQFGEDSAAAATYAINWTLALRSVNYLAEDSVPSPLQHYWSLAVEEQFYLFWPLVMILLGLVARRCGRSSRVVLAIGAGLIVGASFCYALARVNAGEASAYFTTTTRLWELAIGAVGAVTIGRPRRGLGSTTRTVLVLAGLGCLACSVLFLSGRNWPGWPALLPTAGAVAVIIGGDPDNWQPVRRLLAAPVLVWIGGVSYPIYLWHWPLITLAHYRWSRLSPLLGLGILAVTILLAWATQKVLEGPIRFSPWFRLLSWRPFALAAVCMVISWAASLSLVLAAPNHDLIAPAGAQPQGAKVLPASIDLTKHPVWSQDVRWILPSPLDALKDVPTAYADGCQQSATDADPVSCTYGDQDSKKVVAVVGDSKALQWLPAIDSWAGGHALKVVTYLKSSCPLSDATVNLDGSEYLSCRQWNTAVMQRLVNLHPALVVTSQVRPTANMSPGSVVQNATAMVDGLERAWTTLMKRGIPVVAVADTPQPRASVYECVAAHADNLGSCDFDRRQAVAASALPSQTAAVRALGGTTLNASAVTDPPGSNRRLYLLDLTDAVCPDAHRCPPVVGNVLIYRSGSHLTKTYVISLSDRLSTLLDKSALVPR
jgi:peptidoglycan/LPS O-acetylase OafA/YrhL